ncbi:MAG: hypothetical protein K9M99_04420, partial [Candidatus Cloacimonetes bacterium]|nr:hypothetical protein [Candidatus Cloacimonadota bacterium]
MNNVSFYDNTASRGGVAYGHGLWIYESSHILMYENEATSYGGALYLSGNGGIYHDYISLNKATIADNECNNGIGGIYVQNEPYTDLTLINCIIWGNDGNYQLPTVDDITYCCIEDGPTTNHNIDDDPEFVNAAGDDYSLEYFSPCIDAGDRDSDYDDEDESMADMG